MRVSGTGHRVGPRPYRLRYVRPRRHPQGAARRPDGGGRDRRDGPRAGPRYLAAI